MVSKTYPHVEIDHNSHRNQDAVHRPMKSCFSWWSIWRQGWVNQELLHTKCMGKLYWKENSPLKMMVCFCFQGMTPGLCERKRLETTQMRSTCVTLILHLALRNPLTVTWKYRSVRGIKWIGTRSTQPHHFNSVASVMFCHVLSRHVYIYIYIFFLYTYIFIYAYRQFPVAPTEEIWFFQQKQCVSQRQKLSSYRHDAVVTSFLHSTSAMRICWLLLVEWVTNYQTQTEPPEMCIN